MPPEAPTVRWQPDRTQPDAPDGRPGFFTAIGRGLLCKCPNCGKAPAFRGYLTVVPECPACGTPLGSVRADDAPPYFTIFIVGHVLVPIMFWQDFHYNPPIWLLAAIWLPATALACLLLLRPIKGATLIGDGPTVLTRVLGVGDDLALDEGVGVCGKGGQSVPAGVGQPTLLIDGLTVGGTAV